MSSPGDGGALEFIVEFGEPVYLRPGGCPECGESVTVDAESCGSCGAGFEPWSGSARGARGGE